MLVQYTGETIPNKIEKGEYRKVAASARDACTLYKRDGKTVESSIFLKSQVEPADEEAKKYMIFGE